MRHHLLLPASLLLLIAPIHLTAAEPTASSGNSKEPLHQRIDQHLAKALADAGINPAPVVEDAVYVRRVSLDLIGRIPTAWEVAHYCNSTDPNRKESLVDTLMASDEYVQQQADRMNVMLMSNSGGDLRKYLSKAWSQRRPWDQVFRELMLPNYTDPEQEGSGEYLRRRANDTDTLTTDVSRAFFGIDVSCAQCHDHPYVSDWSQDVYYGMKSFFNRTFQHGEYVGEKEYGLVDYQTTSGEKRQAKLAFLTGLVVAEPEYTEPEGDARKKIEEQIKKLAKDKKPAPEPSYSRRAQLVEVALAPEQADVFARAIVNRIWYQYFGYGMVMPLDQMHAENPASHPELLTMLANELRANGYDLHQLIRAVVLTDAYARQSSWQNPSNPDRPSIHLFAVAHSRALTPLQYSRSLTLAAADPLLPEQQFDAVEQRKRAASFARTSHVSVFEEPDHDFNVPVDEALFMTNSDRVAKELLEGGLVRHLRQLNDQQTAIKIAYAQILSRSPQQEEVQLCTDYLNARSDRRDQAWSQLVWALLTSSEFRFNY